jgi:hypothetical protein
MKHALIKAQVANAPRTAFFLKMQEQAMVIACGRMLLCAEAGFKDSSGKRRYGRNEKIGASPLRCLRRMGDDKLPTSYTVLQFITPPPAFLLSFMCICAKCG